MQIEIRKGLPKSHQWKHVSVNKRQIKGIVWAVSDIYRKDTDTLYLYKKWPTVHFESDWYEISAEDVASPIHTQRDVAFLLKKIKPYFPKDGLMIDVHCGSGRHVISLTKRGLNVIGLEGSRLLRNLAKDKAVQSGLDISFFPTTKKYKEMYTGAANIVTTFFNSMGYSFSRNEDISRLRWISNLLRKNGILVIDIRSGEYQKKKYKIFQEYTENFEVENKSFHVITKKFCANDTLAAVEEVYASESKKMLCQRTTYGWKIYSLNELKEMLREVGIEIIDVVQDYYSNKNNMGERIFLIGKKLTD